MEQDRSSKNSPLPVKKNFLVDIYLFKAKKRNTRKRFEMRSKLTIQTTERRFTHFSGVFTVDFEQINFCWAA